MTQTNINTLTFNNHDTYIYYADTVLKSSHIVTLIPTNPEDTNTVIYKSNETNLLTNGVNNGIMENYNFIRSKSLNSIFNSTIITIITDDGILMANIATELDSKNLFNSGKQIKTLATYKSDKYKNYINVEIQIDTKDTYRIVTISY